MAFAINGKFTSQSITGVQRVAYELTRAMQMRAAPGDEPEVFVPQNAVEPGALLKRQRRLPWLRGTLWEQITLPIAARGVTLLSLCNTSPLFKQGQVVMVYDMAVYDVPQGFSKKFRLWYRICFALLPRTHPIVLTVSTFSKMRICHHLKIDESRVKVVAPGADHLDRIVADPSVLQRLELNRDAYCVIVGSLDPRKNLRGVLDAIVRLGHLGDVKFVIVGKKNPRIFSSTGVEHPVHSRQVVWAGFVSDAELKALYESAGCLVFPSLYEGFGLPPLEAMYCGCPVIASARTSIPEACGDAAMYCDATSADDIAAKIAQMMSDADLRQRYRGAGLLHAREFRWECAAQKVLEILDVKTGERLAELTPRASAN
ncbi:MULTISPECIES: glycosyltransferase family 1 protein [unclassified Paraburkholderia]|uniref:glycosyltransferase family 4 protein n=1 Tax=unclassified Paraburkholderia TaxID=2615204 RepID=UPI001607777F|nr:MULTISPECIES: glycosyltransferase family 1 protein [unclassified Paraburkholderia]MBB5444745.1 glycosyltransferase involved in cell wall biosynthesis [Paraburkholderia sp. WSM4177]MBB5484896.1 glycosyltransferase involved in cell wall biosynthesis [Paraburkholderia sp. WSM4180]